MDPPNPQKVRTVHFSSASARNCLQKRSFATIAAFPRSHPTIVSVEPSVIQRNRGPFQFRYERGMGNPR